MEVYFPRRKSFKEELLELFHSSARMPRLESAPTLLTTPVSSRTDRARALPPRVRALCQQRSV